VVEDRQDQGLEDDALGERPGDREDRRPGKEQLPFGVAVDVSGEAVAREPVQRPAVDDAGRAEVGKLVGPEAEVRHGLDHPRRTGHHAVPAPRRQPAREHLEHARPVGGSVAERGADHRQLVMVGEK
jgi:hypothetical protein